jgi:type II secretory pathway pseudopilin PulG
MKIRHSSLSMHANRPAGFSRADMLTTIAVISVLAAMVIVPLRRAQNRGRINVCQENLLQVSRAILTHANDHQARLPGPAADISGDLWWWYKEQIKGHLGMSGPSSANDRVFACPMDRGYSDPKPFCQNARFDFNSYAYNGVTLPGLPNIAGWNVSDISQPKQTLLVMEWAAHAPLSWHRSRTGKANAPFYNDAESIVAFSDGHAGMIKVYYDGYNAAYTRDPIRGYDYKYSGK